MTWVLRRWPQHVPLVGWPEWAGAYGGCAGQDQQIGGGGSALLRHREAPFQHDPAQLPADLAEGQLVRRVGGLTAENVEQDSGKDSVRRAANLTGATLAGVSDGIHDSFWIESRINIR